MLNENLNTFVWKKREEANQALEPFTNTTKTKKKEQEREQQ